MEPTELDLPAPQDVPGLLMQTTPLAVRVVTNPDEMPMTIAVASIARMYPTRVQQRDRDLPHFGSWKSDESLTTIVFKDEHKVIVMCPHEELELLCYGQVPSPCPAEE